MIKIQPLRFERRAKPVDTTFLCVRGEAGVSEVAVCCCLLQDDTNVILIFPKQVNFS